MLFNSFNFVFFFIPALIGFYLINKAGNLTAKNLFLLIVSYIFYGMFNVNFLVILAFVTIVNFVSIKMLSRPTASKRFATVTVGIILSLLPLFVFKYTDFILNSVLMIGGVIVLVISFYLWGFHSLHFKLSVIPLIFIEVKKNNVQVF